MTWTTRPRSEIGGLAAVDRGTGPCVLLLHGVGLRAEAWNAQIEALAGQVRVVAKDMPGHGKSALPDHPMSLAEYADAALAGLADEVVVVGHSMGAMIALDLAVRFPERVRGVVALNAIFQRAPEAAAAVQERAAALDGRRMADPSATLRRWFGDAPSPERDACARWLNDVDPAGYSAAYSVFAAEDGPTPAALTGLGCPALFVTGAQEPNSTPAMSQAMAALAPQGRAVIIEGAAHMMPMTHAAEVNALLADFLREVCA